MSLSTPIPTKYRPETLADLRAMSDRTGLPISTLIRAAVVRQLDAWKSGKPLNVNASKRRIPA